MPKEVLGAVKMTINALFRENDFLSSSNSVTVRALLVMSLHADLHGPAALQSGTRCWNRTGAAIRMAQDLGLHRDASGKDDLSRDAFFLEQKRRIWGCCVTADRMQSIALGHPMMIDLTDCDVRLPSPFEILRSPNDLPSDPSTDRPFAYNTEMLKLTILFGRVMKTIYSPTGLMNATDEEILSLLRDIDAWKAALPAELVFKGADSSAPAGILHVGFACLMMLFFRVFMRISYICPTHLKFSLTIDRMSALIQYSTEAIAWVDKNDFYLDTMQIVSYCLVSCATVQYHAFVRRGDTNAQMQLKKLNDIMGRYRRENHEPDDVSMRGKAASVISLLCDSCAGVYANTRSNGTLNPTAGVTNRKSRENVRGIVFKPDASRPGAAACTLLPTRGCCSVTCPRARSSCRRTRTAAESRRSCAPATIRTADGRRTSSTVRRLASRQAQGRRTALQLRLPMAALPCSTASAPPPSPPRPDSAWLAPRLQRRRRDCKSRRARVHSPTASPRSARPCRHRRQAQR